MLYFPPCEICERKAANEPTLKPRGYLKMSSDKVSAETYVYM